MRLGEPDEPSSRPVHTPARDALHAPGTRALIENVVADRGLSRRQVLRGALGVGAAAVGIGVGTAEAASAEPKARSSSLHLPSRFKFRRPGSLPDPSLPEGTDTLPEIDHIVVVMQENHSFDNYLGMLGRGDGFTLDPRGRPVNTNPDPAGGYVRAFHETDTSQAGHVTQSWDASHLQYANGKNDGFIGPGSSSEWSMAYYTGEEIPFYYSLARTFPLCDRYFCSVLAQTYPNRRFLMAGTAFGLIATDTSSITGIPPNGTIFDRLDAHEISWASYATNVSTLFVIEDVVQKNPTRIKTIDQFHADAKAGSLPAVSYVDPNILTATEENPQDLALGEYFVSTVVGSLLNSPAWHRTLLVWTYDEHGGYYDHVPPPPAIPPDDIPPNISATDQPGGYDRYGFRVPTVVVSPYGKPDFVSHTVYDHTSVLKTIERKWNLPAMTYRDANANDLLDCLDLRKRAFADPPTLAAPGNTTGISTATPPPAGEEPPFAAFVKGPGPRFDVS
jgi:phospholipase C